MKVIISSLLTCAMACGMQPLFAPAAWSDGNDNPPKDGKSAPDSPPPLTNAERKSLEKKDALAKKAMKERLAAQSSRATTKSASWGSSVGVIHQTEIRKDWCGVASFAIAHSGFRHEISQDEAASILGIGPNDSVQWQSRRQGGKPMVNALNKVANGEYKWDPAQVPMTATSLDKAAYRWRIPYAIDRGYPVVANLYMLKGARYAHLKGYPTDRDIRHWVVINGYYANGAGSYVVDPASGQPGPDWENIPAFSSVSSDLMVRLTGDRGYIW